MNNENHEDIRIGDLVIIGDDDMNDNNFRSGRVLDIYTGYYKGKQVVVKEGVFGRTWTIPVGEVSLAYPDM